MVTAACGTSSQGASSGGGLPSTIQLASVMDLTGPAGLAGTGVRNGIQFAVDEINRTGFLGSSKVSVDFQDTQSNREQAVSLMTQTASGSAPAVFGPVASSETLAVVPIAQRKGLPYVATQSQTAGVVETGNYIFRLTAPQSTFQNKTAEYLAGKGVKTATVVYLSEGAANAQWGKTLMPDALKAAGVNVLDSVGVQGSETDFSSLVTRLRAANPGAIGISVIGPQNSTLVSQLRQQGYTGTIFGDLGFSGGTLQGAGPAANGVVFATDFSPFVDFPSSKTFVDAWKAANGGKDPQNFNSEGYDAMWFVARAIKEGQTVDRASLRNAMERLAGAGFDGAAGPIKFNGRDERVGGTVVQWKDGAVAAVDK
jgi:branched-chain amino acid transport system substrate-binding protein